MYSIKSVLSQYKKKLSLVPSVHVETLRTYLNDLSSMESQAQRTVSQQAVLGLSLTEVGDTSVQATNHMSLVKGMLTSV